MACGEHRPWMSARLWVLCTCCVALTRATQSTAVSATGVSTHLREASRHPLPIEDNINILSAAETKGIQVTGGEDVVLRAFYGDPAKPWKRGEDVTDTVKALLRKEGDVVVANNQHFGDPVKGVKKVLLVKERQFGMFTPMGTPLWSCESVPFVEETSTPWSAKLNEAATFFCNNETQRPYMEVFLEKRFEPNYENAYGGKGWLDEAWVNYVKTSQESGDAYAQLTERLVDSAHRLSEKPIVVVNFGDFDIPELDPDRFPRLVMMRARDISELGLPYNFNKIQAIMLAHVKVGASLDSDMLMLGPQADRLLSRTKEEITERYPYPMLPVHFLDRDPEDQFARRNNYLKFSCRSCPKPTLRWGHAQPTWTYWSLPFLARWQAAKLAQRSEKGVPTDDITEDEDLLNVALWREGASKEWCVFQTAGADSLWLDFLPQHTPGPDPYYDDPKRFPEGLPIGYYFTIGEKNLTKLDRAMSLIESHKSSLLEDPANSAVKVYFYNRKFYSSFAELKARNPSLHCML